MTNEFNKLKKKILWQVLIVIGIALGMGFLIQMLLVDGILEKPFANFFVDTVQNIFDWDYYQARYLYVRLFTLQKSNITIFGLLVLIVVILYLSLTRFLKYFKEINAGIDKLLDENKKTIKISSELDFVEDKLNQVKSTLASQKQIVKETEQRKNDLIVYLAHDLKTPLTSIVGYLELLVEHPELSTQEKAKYTHIAFNKARHLEELIAQFFDITRFSLQDIKLKKTTVNLNLMMEQIVDDFYPLAQKRKLKIDLKLAEKIKLSADRDKLARAIQNLIKNALTYAQINSTIEIEVAHIKDKVHLTVTNQGPTIPKKELKIIFDKFYRTDKSRSSKTGGAGLGLAIVKEIVLAHQGTVEVQSLKGQTTFTIILP